MWHKIFDKNLVAIRRSKVTLKVNKAAYIGMCILELHKVLMYKFHDDYILKVNITTNENCYSQALIV